MFRFNKVRAMTSEEAQQLAERLEKATEGFVKAAQQCNEATDRATKVLLELSKVLDRAEKVPPRTAARRTGW